MIQEPNFDNVPHQVHNILITELKNASQELYDLLSLLIENSDFLSEKAENSIKSVEDLIEFLENHTIWDLEEMLS